MASAAPPPEPLTLDQAKAHLRVTDTYSDDLISGLITAAREYAEDYTGLCLVPVTLTETAQRLGRWIDLDSWPVSDVTAVRYPLNGTMTTLAADAWVVNLTRRPARIVPVSWGWGIAQSLFSSMFSGNGAWAGGVGLPVEIDVTAGFATPDDVPQTVKQAMLLLIQSWFDNRSAVEAGLRAAAIEVPFTVDVLLRKHRRSAI